MANEALSNTNVKSDAATLSRPPVKESASQSIGHVVVCNALGVGHYQPAKAFVSLLASSSIPVHITFFSVIRKNEEAKCVPVEASNNVAYRRAILDGDDVHPITMQAMITRKESLQKELSNFLSEVREKNSWASPCAIVHDPFALFARQWGISHNIPCVIFNPSNGFFWGLMKTERFMEKVMTGQDSIEVDSALPRVRGQLMWNMIQGEADTPEKDREPVLRQFKKLEDLFNHACGVVGNDVLDLYPWAIKRLSETYNTLVPEKPPSGFSENGKCHFEYYCVSPLCIMESSGADEDLGMINNTVSLKYWLDQKEPKSVIYVALGTLYPMKREVVKALFESLKHCPFSFVWSYREMHSPPAITPAMLASLPMDKGVMLPWVKQKPVLMHRALRLFISHCGWNSTLENMCFGGIPTLCVPLGSDQVINTIMLCDVLGCGRLGMVENEEWKSKDWKEEKVPEGPQDVAKIWERGSTIPLKYRFPERDVDFSRLIRETADVYYNDLLLQAKEVQVKVLKAGSYQGDMIRNVERFATFVNQLKSDARGVVDEEYERQRARLLLMSS
eukprot:Gregarina_sp_Pseudo_9__5987@NODE_986_length_2000_cov_181_887302_g924_i0_p1_GENE_NODE_986_length_2000_cov_181_887302_g924_i0NODE_986_length_2000_cov_181_887302_g924_i0_p1_ORF_typecomplete_len561_score87_35UDPGT/PF00201_18/1e32Glyco_tran_28_C/PF04101_16/0_0044_NODE_986_length_2000_cov_181_887302_g924_i0871769